MDPCHDTPTEMSHDYYFFCFVFVDSMGKFQLAYFKFVSNILVLAVNYLHSKLVVLLFSPDG